MKKVDQEGKKSKERTERTTKIEYMTTEEKAKAYDEALERAKDIMKGPSPKDGALSACRYILPELKESEDEKIRMWLIRLINTAGYRELDTDPMPVPRREVVAWLEKKGEQKPAVWSEEDERIKDFCIAKIKDELDEIRNDVYGHSEIISDLKEGCRERIKWLKSLKERYTWKPSDSKHKKE